MLEWQNEKKPSLIIGTAEKVQSSLHLRILIEAFF